MKLVITNSPSGCTDWHGESTTLTIPHGSAIAPARLGRLVPGSAGVPRETQKKRAVRPVVVTGITRKQSFQVFTYLCVTNVQPRHTAEARHSLALTMLTTATRNTRSLTGPSRTTRTSLLHTMTPLIHTFTGTTSQIRPLSDYLSHSQPQHQGADTEQLRKLPPCGVAVLRDLADHALLFGVLLAECILQQHRQPHEHIIACPMNISLDFGWSLM